MFLMFVWRATLKVSFSSLSFHNQTLLMNSPIISSCYLGLGFQHKIHDELILCIFAPSLKCDEKPFKHFHLVPRTTTTNKQKQKEAPKRAANCSLHGLVSRSAYTTLLIISPLQSYAESLSSHPSSLLTSPLCLLPLSLSPSFVSGSHAV